MYEIVKIIFLTAALIIRFIGLIPSIAVFGLSPIYCFMYFYFCRKNIILPSISGFFYLSISIVIAFLVISVLWITAMSLGMWG